MDEILEKAVLFIQTLFNQMVSHFKSKWFVYVLLLIFAVLGYIMCVCSWRLIDCLVNETPKQPAKQEPIKIQVDLSDSLNGKILDEIRNIHESLRMMESVSSIVTIRKVHVKK